MAENYDLIFGQSASSQYAWSDGDYQNGWQTVGSTPPTAEQFDALQRKSDTKAKDLNDRLSPLEEKAEADGRQASTAYTAGTMVTVDGLPNGWLLECVVPGNSGAGAITLPPTLIDGLTIVDDGVTWKLRKVATNGGIGYRQPSTAYAVGNIAYHASLPTGWCLKCATAGMSGTDAIDFSSSKVGDTITDGGVTWTVVKYALTTDVPPLASALATPRKIELTGKAKGSTSFDGSTDASINVTSVNADTASKATQDSTGQQINSTYIKGLSASGKTITYTRGDNTTGTITTQDTVYTHPNSGVSAGTYKSVTVNAQGHVTAGSNPTTLSGYGITDAPTKTGGGASGTWGISINGNASTATNADKLDGYHYSDIVTKIQGKTTPTMTALVNWAAMTTACNLSPATVSVSTVVDGSSVTLSVPSIKSIRNRDTGIMAYGGDYSSGSMPGTNRPFYGGDIILKQSYKNFDKILIVFCNDDGNIIFHNIWEKWELEYAFDHSRRFALCETHHIYWWLWGTKKQGTDRDQRLSTDTFWRAQEQNSSIVEIFGLKY